MFRHALITVAGILAFLSAGISYAQFAPMTLWNAAVVAAPYPPTCTPQPWTSRTSPADNEWRSIAYGNGTFVAVAYTGTGNSVMSSPDGVNWTIRVSAADNDWNAVTFGNGLFVALGATGSGNRVMTSPDGITWTLRSSAADNTWRGVVYATSKFVGVSETGSGNRVMTSTNGTSSWATQTTPSSSWQAITYGNSQFVAVGTGTAVMTSSNGTSWTAQTGANNSWKGVAYGAGLYTAVGHGAGDVVMTSPDGTAWTSRTSPNHTWYGITYQNGLFVAVGGGAVMTSPDGINWTSQTPATGNTWRAVAYGNGMFVAVSNSGTGNRVMTSPCVASSVTSVTYHALATAVDTTSITIPATAQPGDLAILVDATISLAASGAPPTTVVPPGFSQITNTSGQGAGGAYNRMIVSAKIIESGDVGATLTTMAGGATTGYQRKAIAIYRPNTPAISFVVGGINQQMSTGVPTNQTLTTTGGNTPLIAFAAYRAGAAISTRGFSPAEDAELAAGGTAFYLKHKIYNSGPANHTISMPDTGNENIMHSLYFELH